MKSKYITNIIVEGPDGVGKTTLYKNLLEHYGYRIPVYDRGELSNFVYAKKYGRPFSAMQRHLPILYVLLLCDKETLANRIAKRGAATEEELKSELSKVDDVDVFAKYLNEFKKDYHVVEVDTTALDERETLEEAVKLIDRYVSKFAEDPLESYSSWNKAYYEQCKKLGLDYKVISNQPFINGKAIMAETNLHQGIYETFTDKRCPHNLIYCEQYFDKPLDVVPFDERKEDFTYVINSKIFSRHEVYDYFNSFAESNLSCVTGVTAYSDNNPLIKPLPRVFGNDYIHELSKAKATIYIARRMEYLKYCSTRLYESILADNVIFVDKLSDSECDILRQIHGDDDELIGLLYVTPEDVCESYMYLMKHKELVEKALYDQREWYSKTRAKVLKDIKKGNTVL